MNKLIELREMLMDELEQITKRGSLTEGILGIVQKLTHSIKSIDTIMAMAEASHESREGTSGRRYRDGGSRESRESRDGGSQEGGSRDDYSGRRYFYTQRDGYSGRRLRDSMGRYADGGSQDGYSGRRGYSREEAKEKLVAGLEGMMDDVSPKAQSVIEKAIRALEQE